MSLQFVCQGCGSNRFPFDQVEKDTSVVICGDCGLALGTFGEVKQLVASAVEQQPLASAGRG